jgi:hypothetical protein
VRAPEKPLDVRAPFPEIPRSLADMAGRAGRAGRAGLALLVPFLVLGAGFFGACGPSDPAQEVEDARSRYSVEVPSFSVDQTPAAGDVFTPPPEGEEGEATEAGVAGEGAAEDAGAMEPAEPVEVSQDVILDLLVRWNGRDPLPGITVDITHADADGNEKAVYRAYLETSDVHRGPPTQMVHRLEDVDYVEGDGFHAEVRSPVPAGERGEYREFSEGGEGS